MVSYKYQPLGAVFITKIIKENLAYKNMKLIDYIRDTRGEMKHINWPTRREAVNYTLLVIGISLATALILALADYVFGLGIEKIIL